MKPRRFVRMFKPQFAKMVRDSIKLQTVRPIPKRMPVPGDIIDCREWSGKPYRSQQVRLKESEIVRVETLSISEHGLVCPGEEWNGEEFARRDGFLDFDAMLDWFKINHKVDEFTGIVIVWKP